MVSKARISKVLERELLENGADSLISNMYDYFNRTTGRRYFKFKLMILDCLHFGLRGTFDANIRKDFSDWFSKIFVPESQQDLAGDNFEDFKALMSSLDFMLLCFYLYNPLACLYEWDDKLEDRSFQRLGDVISLKGSDNVVCKMDKRAATTESEVLKDLIDSTGGGGEIPVNVVSGDILSKVVGFCEKQLDFRNLFKSVADRYKDFVKGFVNTNRAILSDLHQAADFLNIPSLLDLTLGAVGLGDMMGNAKALEDISEWYAGLSISRMLSSLGVGQEVRNQRVTPWAFA